jgi:hypothetical protein
MMVSRLILPGTLVITCLAAAPALEAQGDHTAHGAAVPPGLVRVVRDATRPFLDVNAAVSAGYGPFLGCVSGTQEGAMGVHYVDGNLVGDGQLDAEHPEALMYEKRNGRLQLLGVEYIVMVDAWHQNNELPPTLLGQVFTYNASPNRYGLPPFYALHVWAWRDNPSGTFVDWNPRVSCTGFTADQ